MRTQQEKAQELLALHRQKEMLLLPNVWNPIGARILEERGFPAVATASAALSASLGYADGERLQRSTLIYFLDRIAASVDVPVTADIESGYGASTAELRETIGQVIGAGIVGVNIEDSLEEGGALRSIDDQCERIAAVRDAATERGVRLVINARVDCFLSAAYPDAQEALEESVTRAEAYSAAGSDCIYPIGPGDPETVGELRSRISSPINILASAHSADLTRLQAIGVNRVSFGPFVFRASLAEFMRQVDGIAARASLERLVGALSGEAVSKFLRDENE